MMLRIENQIPDQASRSSRSMINDTGTTLERNVDFVVAAGECRKIYMYVVVESFAADDTGYC